MQRLLGSLYTYHCGLIVENEFHVQARHYYQVVEQESSLICSQGRKSREHSHTLEDLSLLNDLAVKHYVYYAGYTSQMPFLVSTTDVIYNIWKRLTISKVIVHCIIYLTR